MMTTPNPDQPVASDGRLRLPAVLLLLAALGGLAGLVWASAPEETPPASWAPREPAARPGWIP